MHFMLQTTNVKRNKPDNLPLIVDETLRARCNIMNTMENCDDCISINLSICSLASSTTVRNELRYDGTSLGGVGVEKPTETRFILFAFNPQQKKQILPSNYRLHRYGKMWNYFFYIEFLGTLGFINHSSCNKRGNKSLRVNKRHHFLPAS